MFAVVHFVPLFILVDSASNQFPYNFRPIPFIVCHVTFPSFHFPSPFFPSILAPKISFSIRNAQRKAIVAKLVQIGVKSRQSRSKFTPARDRNCSLFIFVVVLVIPHFCIWRFFPFNARLNFALKFIRNLPISPSVAVFYKTAQLALNQRERICQIEMGRMANCEQLIRQMANVGEMGGDCANFAARFQFALFSRPNSFFFCFPFFHYLILIQSGQNIDFSSNMTNAVQQNVHVPISKNKKNAQIPQVIAFV